MPEKLQTLLLILLGLVFFAVRMWRKAQEAIRREAQERKLPNPAEVRPGSAPRPVRPPGAPSFEEMLRQMQEQNRRGQAPASPAAPAAPRPVTVPSTSERTTAEARSLEKATTPVRSLEERPATRAARSLEVPAAAPRQAATLPRAAAVPQNDYWSREAARRVPATSTAADVAQKLRNPAELRTAFILAEVLKRRYE